jgi:hypothetical protein
MTEERKSKLGGFLAAFVRGSFLSDPRIIAQWPFFLFLVFLAVISIASSHSADKKVAELSDKQKVLKDLRSEFVFVRKEVMNRTRVTVITENAEQIGLIKTRQGIYKVSDNDQ